VTRDRALGALGLIIAYATGQGYVGRLSQHAGFDLVAVPNEAPSFKDPPQRAFVIVVDGLRRDKAAQMRSAEALRARGVCVPTDVGPLGISRPVYAVLSTGVEQDRTGSRSNADTDPLRAESIWQTARASGWSVVGRSELPWFAQLFPDGFDRFDVVDTGADLFAGADATATHRLTLLHPVYVDETAHDHGAASPEYDAAVARADAEISGLLARLDLDRDVVVLTADHGHVARGGHGGRQDDAAIVLTCLAGKGVAKQASTVLPMRAIAPLLAALLFVPFPRHLRADGVDLSLATVPSRAETLARFVRENPDWPAVYARAQRWQWVRGGGVLALTAAALARAGQLAPVLAIWIATAAAVRVERGAFDFTAIKQENPFVLATALDAAAVLGVALLLLRRRVAPRTLLRPLVAGTIGLCAAHVVAYGWPLGFPLPGPELLFAPFVLAIALSVYALGLLVSK
jgi:hypothetical protein